jgi:hypothetical protein
VRQHRRRRVDFDHIENEASQKQVYKKRFKAEYASYIHAISRRIDCRRNSQARRRVESSAMIEGLFYRLDSYYNHSCRFEGLLIECRQKAGRSSS